MSAWNVLSNFHQLPGNSICTPRQDCLPGPVIVLLAFPRMGRARGLPRTGLLPRSLADRPGTNTPRHAVRRSGPEQRRARARDPPAVLAVARGPGCSSADVLLVTHKSLCPGAGRKRAAGSRARPGGRGAFRAGRGRCPAPGAGRPAAFRVSPWRTGRLPPPRTGSRPKVLPRVGTRGPGRSADSCQADSRSRASALPGLRSRAPVISSS